MKLKHHILAAAIFLPIMLFAHGYLFAEGEILLKNSNGQALITFKENNIVLIGDEAYHYKRWGINRLKLIGKSAHQGIFLKRLGINIMIRDLGGSLLHIVRKEGFVFKVVTPIGENLVFVKISPQKVEVFRHEGSDIFTLTSSKKGVLIKDASKKVLYTLKGETKTLPASFLCIPELSWQERAACFLLYESIPYPYQ